MARRRSGKVLPAVHASACLLVRLNPHQVGMFRFLLEAWDQTAGFVVLDRHEALLKLFFSPHQEDLVSTMLHCIGQEIAISVMPWPVHHESL